MARVRRRDINRVNRFIRQQVRITGMNMRRLHAMGGTETLGGLHRTAAHSLQHPELRLRQPSGKDSRNPTRGNDAPSQGLGSIGNVKGTHLDKRKESPTRVEFDAWGRPTAGR